MMTRATVGGVRVTIERSMSEPHDWMWYAGNWPPVGPCAGPFSTLAAAVEDAQRQWGAGIRIARHCLEQTA